MSYTSTAVLREDEYVLIQASFESDEVKTKAAKELSQSYASPEFGQQALTDIQNLRQMIKDITKAFVDVRGSLRRFDQKRCKDKFGKAVRSLTPEWDVHRKASFVNFRGSGRLC
jgi:hypothetical protein